MCYLLLLQPNYNNYESRLFSPIFIVLQTNNNNSITHTHVHCLGWTFWQAKKMLGTGRSTVATPARKFDSLLGPLCVCVTATSLENRFLWLFFREAGIFMLRSFCISFDSIIN